MKVVKLIAMMLVVAITTTAVNAQAPAAKPDAKAKTEKKEAPKAAEKKDAPKATEAKKDAKKDVKAPATK